MYEELDVMLSLFTGVQEMQKQREQMVVLKLSFGLKPSYDFVTS